VREIVLPVLVESQARGFLGPGPVDVHIDHASPLAPALPREGLIADLGSGGGVPALILALLCQDSSWLLIESQHRRAAWLRAAVIGVGLAPRVAVIEARAEEVGRSAHRATAAAVTARSFARPGVTAECAAPLLRVGGSAWVAEPPRSAVSRWPAGPLAELGLRVGDGWEGWARLELERPCPDRYPRRVGVPAKRPLF
jgi:16S rRNA (guanine527-N7)-methyltransferase